MDPRPFQIVALTSLLLYGVAGLAFCGFYVARADTRLFDKDSPKICLFRRLAIGGISRRAMSCCGTRGPDLLTVTRPKPIEMAWWRVSKRRRRIWPL